MKTPEQKIVLYVCSPYRGNVELNENRAESICATLCEFGYLPIAPHLYFTRFLCDEIEEHRTMGIENGLQMLHNAQAVIAIGDDDFKVSRGMVAEITFAAVQHIPVIHFADFAAFAEIDAKEFDNLIRRATALSCKQEHYIYVE